MPIHSEIYNIFSVRYDAKVSQQNVAVLVGATDLGMTVARRLHGHRLIIADSANELGRFVSRAACVRHLIVDTTVDADAESVQSVLQRVWIDPVHILDAFAPIVAAGASSVVICDSSARDAMIDPYDEEALTLLPVSRLPRLQIAAPQRFPDARAARSFAMRAIQLRIRTANAMWTHCRGARVNSLTVSAVSSETCPVAGVADVATFLLSDESRCVAGADIVVDGGMSAAGRYDGEVPTEDILAANDTVQPHDAAVGGTNLPGRFTRLRSV